MSKREFQFIDTPQETLVGFTIPETQDVSCVHDFSEMPQAQGEEGFLVAHFSTDQFAENDGDALPIDLYKTIFFIPTGYIVSGTPVMNVTEVLTGASVAVITLREEDGTTVAHTFAADMTAAGVTSEVAALPIATEAGEDLTVHVQITIATSTAGGFTLKIPLIHGDNAEGLVDFI